MAAWIPKWTQNRTCLCTVHKNAKNEPVKQAENGGNLEKSGVKKKKIILNMHKYSQKPVDNSKKQAYNAACTFEL